MIIIHSYNLINIYIYIYIYNINYTINYTTYTTDSRKDKAVVLRSD